MQAGHVFLVLGDLERLTCDHVVIPGESASPWGVRPGSKWSVVKKESEPDPGLFEDPEKRFRQWAARRPHSHAQAGRDIRDAPAVWVVRAHDTDVVSLLTDLLEAIAEEDPPSSQTRRLVALPLVSTGGGGHLPGVANLLQQLLPRLSELASDTGLDIALVFRGEEPSGGGLDGRAAYAAAQAIRLQQPGRYWPDRRHQYLVEKLAGAAASNHLALFLGAGVSMAAGLPSWDDLLVDLAGDSPSLGKLLDDTEPGSLDPLLRGQLLAAEMSAGELARKISERLTAVRHALPHALLAMLPAREVVTTNYDGLYEQACTDARLKVSTLPGDSPASLDKADRVLVKLHGDLGPNRPANEQEGTPFDSQLGPASLPVFALSDYQQFEHTRGPLSGTLQGLLLTRHVLFVGFSMKDPNFLRVHGSVVRMLSGETAADTRGDIAGELGSALIVSREPRATEITQRLLPGIDCHAMHVENEFPAQGISGQARQVEVLLDELVARTHLPIHHYSEPLFAQILSDSDQAILKELRAITPQLDPGAGPSTALQAEISTLLERLGIGRKG